MRNETKTLCTNFSYPINLRTSSPFVVKALRLSRPIHKPYFHFEAFAFQYLTRIYTAHHQVPCRWRVDVSHSVLAENSDEFRVVPSTSEGVLEVGGVSRYVETLS